jgi:hypothetical protein
VLKKVFGLVLLAALFAAGFMLWQNPALLQALIAWLENALG